MKGHMKWDKTAAGDLTGLVLVVLGVLVWLYGDYYQWASSVWWDYVYAGVGLIVLGVIIWTVADAMAMMHRK